MALPPRVPASLLLGHAQGHMSMAAQGMGPGTLKHLFTEGQAGPTQERPPCGQDNTGHRGAAKRNTQCGPCRHMCRHMHCPHIHTITCMHIYHLPTIHTYVCTYVPSHDTPMYTQTLMPSDAHTLKSMRPWPTHICTHSHQCTCMCSCVHTFLSLHNVHTHTCSH